MNNLIVAYDAERGIGAGNDLLWRKGEMQADMERFRTMTTGQAVIMGRRTLESIGVALPERQNIVISSQEGLRYDGVQFVRSLQEAYAASRAEETYVIGGGQIYEEALRDDKIDRIYATEVNHAFPEVDAFFPTLDPKKWHESSRVSLAPDDNNIYPSDFVTFDRTADAFINLANARTDEQKDVMREILENNECPFCEPVRPKYHKEPILQQGDHWVLTNNQYPYEHTSRHLLAITRYHTEKLADLRSGAMDELQGLLVWAEEEYGVDAGVIAMRFGDKRKTGATIQHLHLHMIVPDPNKPADARIRFKVS